MTHPDIKVLINERDTPLPASLLTLEPQLGRGWDPHVEQQLHALLNRPDLRGSTAAFDCDGTLIRGDGNEAIIEVLHLWQKFDFHQELRSLLGVSFRDDDTPVSFCHDFMSRVGSDIAPSAAQEAIFRWAVRIFEGMSPRDLVEATDAVMQGSVQTTTFIKPEIFTPMAQLIAELRRRGVDVWIITASTPWGVRRLVQQHINPVLVDKGVLEIPLENVVGLAPTMIDKDGAEKSDRDLCADARYLALDRERLSQLKITRTIADPAPTFEGKATVVRSLLPSKPILAAGDGRNDFAMLAEAENRLWVYHESKRALLAELPTALGGHYLVQGAQAFVRHEC
jgi:phosphoserine phosphatase